MTRVISFISLPLAAVALATFSTGAALAGAGESGHGHRYDFGKPGKAAAVNRTVKILATDTKFDIKKLSVKPGETIRFIVTNKGEIEHDFTLGDKASQKAHRKEMAKMMEMGKMMRHADSNAVFLKPGETKQLIWTFPRRGKLEFACNIPGHYESGMKGNIGIARSRKSNRKTHTH